MALVFAVLFSTSILLAQRSFKEPNPSTSDSSFRQSGESFRTTQGDRADSTGRTRGASRPDSSSSRHSNGSYQMRGDFERHHMDRIRDK